MYQNKFALSVRALAFILIYLSNHSFHRSRSLLVNTRPFVAFKSFSLAGMKNLSCQHEFCFARAKHRFFISKSGIVYCMVIHIFWTRRLHDFLYRVCATERAVNPTAIYSFLHSENSLFAATLLFNPIKKTCMAINSTCELV